MPWTREQKLHSLMRLPWTIRPERNDQEGYLVARVEELPSVIATGTDEKELSADFWVALETTLGALLDYGDPIPLPPMVKRLPWEEKPRQGVTLTIRAAATKGGAWETVRRESTALSGNTVAADEVATA